MKRFWEICLMSVHIGQEIQKKYEQSGLKMKEFAKRMNFGVKNVYNIFSRQYPDTEIVMRASEALQFDFFSLLSREVSVPVVSEPDAMYGKLLHENELLKEQLELTNRLIESKEKLLKAYRKKSEVTS